MEPAIAFGQQRMDLRYYWRLFRQRLWLIIPLVLVCLVLGLIHIKRTRPIYQATTKLLIERDTPKLILFDEIIAADKGDDYYQTQFRLLQSRSLARRVIQALDLPGHAEFAPDGPKPGSRRTLTSLPGALLGSFMNRFRQPGSSEATGETAAEMASTDAISAPAPDADVVGGFLSHLMRHTAPAPAPDVDLVSTFLSRLKIQPIPNTRLVNVRFEAHDPHLAADVANTLVRLYIDQSQEMRFAATQGALDWLNQRVSDMRQKVEAAELALQRYKEQHHIFSIDDRLPGVMQELTALNASLTEVRTERMGLEMLYKELQRATGRPERMEWMPAVVENPLIQSLKSNYVDLQRTFSQLGKKYGLEHPRLVQLRSQMDTVKEKIDAEIQKVVQATKANYEVTKAREATLMANVDQLMREAQELNKKAIRYGVLRRDAESNRRLYDILLTRLKETSINTDLKSGDNIRIVDLAEMPRAPTNIHPMRNLITAGLIGLVLGVGLVLCSDYFDNSLKTPDEAEEFLGLPVIGIVGRFKLWPSTHNKDRVDLVTLRYPRSQATEAFKTLRMNLLFSHTETPRKVFLVTSPHAKDGKTTVAANLAVVLEQMERRVLLVDSDLRNPSQHKIFGTSNRFGLSDLLLTEISAPTFETLDGNLSLVPSGKPPPNPSELLGSKRMLDFIAFAREQYDTVILDSPPILAVSDALMLSPLVDGIIIVLRTGSTPRDHVKRALAQLLSLQTEPLANGGREEEGTGNSAGLGLVMNFLAPYESYYSDYYYNRARA